MRKTRIIVGYILISPALLTIVTWIISFFLFDSEAWRDNLFYIGGWIGKASGGTYSAPDAMSYTSPMPLAFGLMAIAGAYLIKDKN